MMLYRTRLMKEQNDLSYLNDPTMIIFPNEQDFLIWYAYLLGPEDSPFQEGIFKIKISIPPTYPVNPPTLHFQTRIFHPNIHFETGEVCLEVLKQEWNPQWTIENIIRAVSLMLLQPNPDSPLNCDAGNLLRADDKIGYQQLAQYYCSKYAINKAEYQSLTKTQDLQIKKTQ